MSEIPGRLSFIGNLFTHYLNLCNYDGEVRVSKILHFYDIVYTLSCVGYAVLYLSNCTCLYFSIILWKIAGWVEKEDLIDIVFREELQCVLNSPCTSDFRCGGDLIKAIPKGPAWVGAGSSHDSLEEKIQIMDGIA